MPDYEYRHHAVNALDRHVISEWTNQETAVAMRGDGERDSLDEWIERRIKAGAVERVDSPQAEAHYATQEVIDAWTVKGPAPEYHDFWKRLVHANWPTLGQALDRLAAEADRADDCTCHGRGRPCYSCSTAGADRTNGSPQ